MITMISKMHGKYFTECDSCGMYYEGFSTFDDAVDHIEKEGWLITRVNGEWTHICPECREGEEYEQY